MPASPGPTPSDSRARARARGVPHPPAAHPPAHRPTAPPTAHRRPPIGPAPHPSDLPMGGRPRARGPYVSGRGCAVVGPPPAPPPPPPPAPPQAPPPQAPPERGAAPPPAPSVRRGGLADGAGAAVGSVPAPACPYPCPCPRGPGPAAARGGPRKPRLPGLTGRRPRAIGRAHTRPCAQAYRHRPARLEGAPPARPAPATCPGTTARQRAAPARRRGHLPDLPELPEGGGPRHPAKHPFGLALPTYAGIH